MAGSIFSPITGQIRQVSLLGLLVLNTQDHMDYSPSRILQVRSNHCTLLLKSEKCVYFYNINKYSIICEDAIFAKMSFHLVVDSPALWQKLSIVVLQKVNSPHSDEICQLVIVLVNLNNFFSVRIQLVPV